MPPKRKTILTTDEIKNLKTEDLNDLSFLTTPDTVDITTFSGDDLDIIFGFIYLMRKYPKTCLPILPKNNGKFPLFDIGIEWICINSKRRMIIPKDFITNFKKCQANKEINYIIMLLTFGSKYGCKSKKYSEYHANMLIYDKYNDIMYRFEPNGCIVELELWYEHKDFDKQFESLIKKEFGIKTYKPPKLSCPFLGLQELQANEKLEHTLDPGGFCATWSLFVIDLVLRNPRKDLKNLQLMALKRFQKNNKELTTFIRNFSSFVIKEKKKLFNKLTRASQNKLLTMSSTIEHLPLAEIKKINKFIFNEYADIRKRIK